MATLLCCAVTAHAQLRTEVSADLPDSPGAAQRLTLAAANTPGADLSESSSRSSLADVSWITSDAAGAAAQSSSPHVPPVAGHLDKYIDPGQRAPSITAGDKVLMGIRSSVTPFSGLGWLVSAAYSQALDSQPNYGQGWGPFGQRLGAAAARGTSEGIFSDSLFAPIFHEDPRYYRLGPGHNIVHRGLYAATRTFVTKTDGGRATPNFSLLAGNASGSILANAVYYPQQNRNVKDTAETFAGSIGGSAVGFLVSEFLSDALGIVHLKKTE